MDNRAASPVIGKLLAAGIAVLFIASATGLLLGGVVPDYHTATGSELGERVLATAAGDIEHAVPATTSNATVHVTRSLPRTIAGERYRLAIINRTLRIDHPDDGIDARTHLSLSSTLALENTSWESGNPLSIRVTGSPPTRTLSLQEGE